MHTLNRDTHALVIMIVCNKATSIAFRNKNCLNLNKHLKMQPDPILCLFRISTFFYVYMQSTGAFYAAARYGSATPVPPHVIGRGAGWVVRSTCTYF